jgi:hypothetical protein
MGANIRTFDYSVNLLKALLWRQNEAPNITALLEAKQAWYDTNQTEFWEDWFTNVFNLQTCNYFGCIVWAIILGLPLTLFVEPTPPATTPFGFDATNLSNFDGSYNFTSNTSAPINFTLAEQRLILQLRYRQLTSRGTVPEINKILKDLIVPTYGPAYVLDGLNMTDKIIFVDAIPSALLTILTELDLLPRPAGVLRTIVDTTWPIFGFGPTNQNFNNGGFTPYNS